MDDLATPTPHAARSLELPSRFPSGFEAACTRVGMRHGPGDDLALLVAPPGTTVSTEGAAILQAGVATSETYADAHGQACLDNSPSQHGGEVRRDRCLSPRGRRESYGCALTL